MADDTNDERPDAVEGALRTFLIADVRGYTRYSDEHGDEAASQLAARFAAIVRSVVPTHGGEVVELRGDEALCVFTSARAALWSAVELQRSFREVVDGQPALPLGVGIGLDAGEAVPTEGGYRGRALNVAARLCSLAKPGEILASETVTNLAGRQGRATFAPRRPTRVKGVGEPIRHVEVVPEDELPPLPPALPPTRPSPRPRRRTRALTYAAVAVIPLVLAAGGALFFAGVGSGDGENTAAIAVRPNSVAVIDPGTNEIVASIPVGSEPGPVVLADGSVWVADAADGTVTRIDPRTRSVTQTIGLGVEPTDLAEGANSVWVAAGLDRLLLRIDTADNRIRARIPIRERIGPLPEGFEIGPSGVAFGSGAVWVVHGEEVSRIDPGTNRVTATIPAGGNWSAAIATGEDRVWVAENGRLQMRRQAGDPTPGVAVIDPTSNSVLASIPIVGLGAPSIGGPFPTDALAVGHGSVWAASRVTDALWRIDPRTNVAVETVPGGQTPENVATASDAIWVENHNEGTVTRIDPFAEELVETIAIGRPTRGIAAGEGFVWVTVRR